MQRRSVFAVVMVVAVMIFGIGSVQAQDDGPLVDESLIEGMFDIGGLELYMRCEGTGSPTIIYLHGWITNHDYSGASSALNIQSQMAKTHRFCIYDRRNVGLSDQVEGYWTGRTAVMDLHTLLDVSGIEPPYVLLGASFGGLLSHMYAATYLDDVVGMVMLDSGVPPEILLDYLVEPEKRLKYGDEIGTNEEIDHFATYHEAVALPPPDIPLIYMHATPTGWTWDDPEWDAAIVPTIRDYVDTLDPGIWVEVESPHFMEEAVPDAIVEQLHNLMDMIEEESTVEEAVSDAGRIEGMFDVGELELYMRCDGTGSPTIIFLHGYSREVGFAGASNGFSLQSQAREDYRFCTYDRRNVGRSEDIDGYWTGVTAAEDLHALLEITGIEPPYILLATSFGSIIAHIYAATYPGEVVGMLWLDAHVPNELELETLLPEEMRYNHESGVTSEEQLDDFAAFEEAIELAAPDIPLIYLYGTQSEQWTFDVAAWDAAIVDTMRTYVDGYNPGIWVEVESPHCIVCSAPQTVIEELHNLMDIIHAVDIQSVGDKAD